MLFWHSNLIRFAVKKFQENLPICYLCIYTIRVVRLEMIDYILWLACPGTVWGLNDGIQTGSVDMQKEVHFWQSTSQPMQWTTRISSCSPGGQFECANTKKEFKMHGAQKAQPSEGTIISHRLYPWSPLCLPPADQWKITLLPEGQTHSSCCTDPCIL